MRLNSTEGSGHSRTVPANDQTRALYEYITYNISAIDNSGALDLYLDEYDLCIDEFKITHIVRHAGVFYKYYMYDQDHEQFELYIYHDSSIDIENIYV